MEPAAVLSRDMEEGVSTRSENWHSEGRALESGSAILGNTYTSLVDAMPTSIRGVLWSPADNIGMGLAHLPQIPPSRGQRLVTDN